MQWNISEVNKDFEGADPQEQSRSTFAIRGHSHRCASLIALREHLLIGISPFNSRFSPAYVDALLTWGIESFSRIDVLLPDEEHTAMLLLATSIPVGKAMRKTRKELNRHRNNLQRILNRLGERAASTRVFYFSDFFDHPEYQRLRALVLETYERCEAFRNACANMSRQAIHGRVQGVYGSSGVTSDDAHNIEIAIPYIFAEMPFYLGTPEFMGVPSSIFAYHRAWPIGDALWAGHFPLTVNKNQGHGILSVVTTENSCHLNSPVSIGAGATINS